MDGHVDTGGSPTPDCEAMNGGHDRATSLRCKPKNQSLGNICLDVIDQHIDKFLKSLEPTNLELGTPDAAALIVRIVRGWANSIAGAHPRWDKMLTSCYQLTWKTPTAELFDQSAWNLPSACCGLCGTMGAL